TQPQSPWLSVADLSAVEVVAAGGVFAPLLLVWAKTPPVLPRISAAERLYVASFREYNMSQDLGCFQRYRYKHTIFVSVPLIYWSSRKSIRLIYSRPIYAYQIDHTSCTGKPPHLSRVALFFN